MVLKRVEGQLAYDFASKAQIFGIDVGVDSPAKLLATMQHFRVPTRLLDWTYSAYVGLYFAFEAVHECNDAALWAVNVSALHVEATLRALPPVKFAGRKMGSPIRFLDFGKEDNFRKHVLPDLDDYHRTLLSGEPALNIVVPLSPRTQNERISAQQGVFLCPSRLNSALLSQMDEMMAGVKDDWITKLVVPRTLREEVLRRLLEMNIHPLTLFPGLDGLGSFCVQKAELHGWG